MQRSTLAARSSLRLATLFIAVLVLFLASFPLGRYPVPFEAVVGILGSKIVALPQTWSDTMETVVLQVRLPRILAALLVGAALAAAGAAYQNIFQNPLVSPAILGVSAGAGFGAALAIVLQFPWFAVQGLAFVFAVVAAGLAVLVGRFVGAGSTIVLVLGGLVISALFQALISILQYLANPIDTLPTITFWLMGGLALPTMAVAWVLSQSAVTAPIVGASKPEQLDATLAAAETRLPDDIRARLDELTREYRQGDSER